MTYMKVVQYSGSIVRKDVEVRGFSRARCVPQELCDEEHIDSIYKVLS